MRRQSRPGGVSARSRRRKSAPRKRSAQKPARRAALSAGGKSSILARITRERDEALEQQAATAELLRVISASPTDLAPVFQAILEKATQLCDARFGNIYRWDGESLHLLAAHNTPEAFAAFRRNTPFRPSPDIPTGRMVATKAVTHVADLAAEPGYARRDPQFVAGIELGGIRTLLSVPMLKDDLLIGAFTLYRDKVRPFSDRQIALVQSFANQAVIAIENARLLNELRQRTADLTEALEQQTATSEVLRVVSSSPSELAPVFQTMLANATRLCEANFGTLNLNDNGSFPIAAMHNVPEAYAEHRRRHQLLNVNPRHPLARVATSKQVQQIADMREEPLYLEGDPSFVAMVDFAGARTLFIVPMLKGQDVVGVITIFRQEVRPFTDKQIALVENFAAQAVIAIENTRLLNELRQRTADLSESLERQTATAEILSSISGSITDPRPVFDAILQNLLRLFGTRFALITLVRDGLLEVAGIKGDNPDFEKLAKHFPVPLDDNILPGKAILSRRTLQLVPIIDNSEAPPTTQRMARQFGYNALMSAPLLRDGVAIGALNTAHRDPVVFTEKQVALIQAFAAQAVIAIENTRLLNELRQRTMDLAESLEQQTATSEVLQVISSSPSELAPVFQTMLANATRLCGAKFGTLYLYDGEGFRYAAGSGTPAALLEAQMWQGRFMPEKGTLLYRVFETRELALSADYAAEPALGLSAKFGGARSTLAVPMLKDDELVGSIVIYRQEVRPFTDKQIELVENFAAQAIIAIENTRLLGELRRRTDDLSESLEQQTATSEVLGVISRSAGDLQPVFEAVLANAVRICEARFGILTLSEGDALHVVAMHNPPPDYAEFRRHEPVFRSPKDKGVNRMMEEAAATRLPVQIADILEDPTLPDDPQARRFVALSGARTIILVPMLKGGEMLGVINIYRQEVRPFTEKQVSLLMNFAAQAVIAIENARLLGELRESLQQQTATADVLKLISRSTFDLQTVLQTLVESAAHLCDAEKATITRQKGDQFYRAETYGFSAEFMSSVGAMPVTPERGSATGRALLEGRVIHIPDVHADPEYTFVDALKFGEFRTILGVPMLREGVPIGVFALTRAEVRPFTDKQIELVSTFADQAAIAIENARLFEAEQQRTRQLAESLDNLRTAQDRLVQTEKLASLGQLTAGIAHEIKNPLNFVNNFSGVSVELIEELRELLKNPVLDESARGEVAELAETLRANLDRISQHGKRADSIVKNMLLHAREGSGEYRSVDINALVEESLNLAFHGARAEKQGFNITLERSFDPGAGTAELFPQEITRVLLNLIANGFYAATKRKNERGEDGFEPALAASTRDLGDRVEIKIRDNGIGIPPEVKDKMFNPFFTTKPAGEGTGLGLSISHDIIVKQHAGTIEVDTSPGEFTEIRVVLPRAASGTGKSAGSG